MTRNWIPLRQVEGTASRQAHVRLPEGTYEREISKEGFFGPSAQFHHKHKPTDWVEFDGAIRPRAFDLNRLATARPSPWNAELVMANPHLQMRIWKLDKPMAKLARNSDGDQLLFIHEGEGALFCDYGHLDYRDGDYLVIPRGTMWRLSPTRPTLSLMVEATNDISPCRRKAWSAGTRSSIRRSSTRPGSTMPSAPSRTSVPGRCR